jgi:Helix-turn-helix.
VPSAGDLQTLLQRLVEHYGTQTALARAIKITDSRLAKVLKGDSGALNVLNCLRLARVANISPSQVLRAAGKGDVAALIEEMYGDSAQPPLPTGAAATKEWPGLSPRAKELLRGFLDEVAARGNKPPRKKRKTP